MEYDIRITIAEHGRDESAGARLLGGFEATHPEAGAAIDQNLRTGELSILFAIEADGVLPEAAPALAERAIAVFRDGFGASGLTLPPVLGVHIEPALAEREVVAA